MAKLYPRLEDFEFEEKIDLVEKEMRENGSYSFNPIESELEWLPVGDRIEISDLKELRDKIIQSVRDSDLSITTTSNSLTKFDRKLGLQLLEWLDITPSIAADNGMWAYLNIMLIPDIIKIRWGYDSKGNEIKINRERYYAGQRSYLKSLWFSAYIIKDSELYKTINADSFVGWFERTSTRGYDKYINIMYTTFINLITEHSTLTGIKELFRSYVKLINRKLAYLNYFALTEDNLKNIAKKAFEESLRNK